MQPHSLSCFVRARRNANGAPSDSEFDCAPAARAEFFYNLLTLCLDHFAAGAAGDCGGCAAGAAFGCVGTDMPGASGMSSTALKPLIQYRVSPKQLPGRPTFSS